MIPKIRTIVVGAAAGQDPDPGLKPAIDLAATLGASLHVVHGFMLNDPLLDAYARSGYLGENTLENFGKDLRSRVESHVAALEPGIPVTVHATAGAPAAAIAETADELDADLIVIGGHHRHGLGRAFLGTTCRGVLRRSTRPVLAMKPDTPALPQRVLVPTDLGEPSAEAYRLAMAIAGDAGSELRVRTLLVVSRAVLALPLEQRIVERVAEEELEAFGAKVESGDAIREHNIRTGDPAVEIVAESGAWNADLIAVGTQGRRGLERLMVGSVAEEVLAEARCNVLLVPPRPERTDGEDRGRRNRGEP